MNAIVSFCRIVVYSFLFIVAYSVFLILLEKLIERSRIISDSWYVGSLEEKGFQEVDDLFKTQMPKFFKDIHNEIKRDRSKHQESFEASPPLAEKCGIWQHPNRKGSSYINYEVGSVVNIDSLKPQDIDIASKLHRVLTRWVKDNTICDLNSYSRMIFSKIGDNSFRIW
ncbi:MAG: hypothetical protein ACMVP2_00630 [Imperialibacter sp.]|uniref:hypothetical protein n=1 Tax=Imperialibacter sp. TaxID=2038411 RepID=UPI003A86691C